MVNNYEQFLNVVFVSLTCSCTLCCGGSSSAPNENMASLSAPVRDSTAPDSEPKGYIYYVGGG